jgi:Ca-activated chloride channel family protein
MTRLMLAWAGAALVAAGVSARGQQPSFTSATQTVSIYATVLQPNLHLATDLTQADFEVADDGHVRPITIFSNEIQPISIAIMLDMSGSMRSSLPLLRAGAVQLFTHLLPADRARVGSFADQILLNDAFTNDPNALIQALYLDLPQSGRTPLWAAVSRGMTALDRVDGRRVVLVFTDGVNTEKQPTLQEVSFRAQAQGFMVYAIGLWNRVGYNTVAPDVGLRQLARETGGGYFELRSADGLGPAFAAVADELHRQYLIGFQTTATDGKLHQIDLRVRRPGLTARARQSYLAPKAAGS